MDSKPPAKRGRGDVDDDEATAALSLSDPLVLKLVAGSGFLPTRDLGRILLLTNPNLLAALAAETCPSFAWKLLCYSHWGETGTKKMLELTNKPTKELFFSMAFPAQPTPKKRPLRPLQYSPKDYVLVVEVRRAADDKLLFLEIVPGDQVPEFFSTGRCRVKHRSKVYLCYATLCSPGGGGLYYDVPKELLTWSAKVHLVRRNDHKKIALCHLDNQVDGSRYGDFELLGDHITSPIELEEVCTVELVVAKTCAGN